jgi:hypothetical protein
VSPTAYSRGLFGSELCTFTPGSPGASRDSEPGCGPVVVPPGVVVVPLAACDSSSSPFAIKIASTMPAIATSAPSEIRTARFMTTS